MMNRSFLNREDATSIVVANFRCAVDSAAGLLPGVVGARGHYLLESKLASIDLS